MSVEGFSKRLGIGAAQVYDFAKGGSWRGRLAQKFRANVPKLEEKPAEDQDVQGSKVTTISELIAVYLSSAAYKGLSVSSKKSYRLYLARINARFGSISMSAFEERGMRAIVRQWRDDVLAQKPRTADSTIAVFRCLLNFGVDQEYVNRNPVAALGRLHTKTRRDIIWSDTQITTFLTKAPRHLARVLLLAIWTGQRQGDLLHLKWDCYDGKHIKLQQRKVARGSSGRRVKVLVSRELRRVLAEIKSEQVARSQDANPKKRRPQPDFILTTAKGDPWRTGFKCAWRNAVDKAEISGVTFHDLRGTFITLSHRAGATIREIAEASGHDEFECERVIRENYLAPGAELVVAKLEASRQFAGPKWFKVNPPIPTAEQDDKKRFTGRRRFGAVAPSISSTSLQRSSFIEF